MPAFRGKPTRASSSTIFVLMKWNDTDEERIVLIFEFDRPMRLPGRLVNRALMWGIKRTAYFKNAERNLNDWEKRLEDAATRVEATFDDVLPRD